MLVSVAERIADVVRPTDTVCRIGDDEFIVLCPEITEPAELLAVAGRIRSRTGAPIADGVVDGTGHVCPTVSIGAAVGKDVSRRHLLARADETLYRAKDGGRDRTELAT